MVIQSRAQADWRQQVLLAVVQPSTLPTKVLIVYFMFVLKTCIEPPREF